MQKSLHSERNRLFLATLRDLRIEAGVTQVRLAEALGMRQTDVSKVERGVRRLDVVELHAWLTALDTSFIKFATELDDQLEALTVRGHAGRRRSATRQGR